jgi:signal transduction histidine kinase
VSEKNAFSTLVVGSSAGGIEVLSELVSTLPEDLSAPVVLAQHLDPERESNLREILGSRSTLPVRTVTDHEPLEGGLVFVAPADRHVNISADEIGLVVGAHGRPKPSVDLLMSSAAEVYGERLIAVVLTGMGTDGADGARLAREMAKTALESTRNLSMELRRSEAEEGLIPALQDLLKVAVPPGVRAELRAEGDESRVPPHVRGQLSAVLREGVRNAVAHSGATHVRVGLDIVPNRAVCSVEDDGRGLPKENGKNGDGTAGVGLRSMRERVGLLGGDFRLSSSPGEGTRVEVTVPLNGRR